MGTFKVDGTEWGKMKRKMDLIEKLAMEAPTEVEVCIEIDTDTNNLDKAIDDLRNENYGARYTNYSAETEKQELIEKLQELIDCWS